MSCAGGARGTIQVEYPRRAVYGPCVQLTVEGLQGGHSGVEIHKRLANANKMMGIFLSRVQELMPLCITKLSGGSKDNAIPRSCSVTLVAMGSNIERINAVAEQLQLVHDGMYTKAKKNLTDHIYEAHSIEEAKALQDANGGFVKTMWCGDLECELKMKEQAGMTSRCIPFAQEKLGETCACCGKKADKMIYWGVAY